MFTKQKLFRSYKHILAISDTLTVRVLEWNRRETRRCELLPLGERLIPPLQSRPNTEMWQTGQKTEIEICHASCTDGPDREWQTKCQCRGYHSGQAVTGLLRSRGTTASLGVTLTPSGRAEGGTRELPHATLFTCPYPPVIIPADETHLQNKRQRMVRSRHDGCPGAILPLNETCGERRHVETLSDIRSIARGSLYQHVSFFAHPSFGIGSKMPKTLRNAGSSDQKWIFGYFLVFLKLKWAKCTQTLGRDSNRNSMSFGKHCINLVLLSFRCDIWVVSDMPKCLMKKIIQNLIYNHWKESLGYSIKLSKKLWDIIVQKITTYLLT